jgi:alpha-L-fucosidase 2
MMIKIGYTFHLLGIILMLVSFKGEKDIEPQSETSNYRHGMTMLKPSEQWREALPSGNGTIGAMVYGSIEEERVLFNHNKLWYKGKIDDIPDMSAELPVLRKLLNEGKYLEANGYYKSKLKEKGFNVSNAVYHPAFDMILTGKVEHLFEDYRRTLDFESGEVEVKWRDGDIKYLRRLFVSIPDDISVMAITSNKKNSVSGEVTLDIHDLNDAILKDGANFDPGFTYKTTAQNEFIEFRADGTDGGEFGGVMRVINKNGTLLTKKGDGKNRGSISFQDADEIVLLVAIYANEESSTAIPRLKNKLSVMSGNYEELFSKHRILHSAKFNAMGINLDINGKKDTPNEI